MTIQTPNSTSNAAIAAEIEALQLRLESLAHAGDWSEFTTAMQRRDELLPTVAVNDRAVVFTSAVRANNRVLKLLRARKQGIADQLTMMRRGRDMTAHYASHREALNTTQ